MTPLRTIKRGRHKLRVEKILILFSISALLKTGKKATLPKTANPLRFLKDNLMKQHHVSLVLC